MVDHLSPSPCTNLAQPPLSLSSSTEIAVRNKVAESSTTDSLEGEFVKDKEFLGHK